MLVGADLVIAAIQSKSITALLKGSWEASGSSSGASGVSSSTPGNALNGGVHKSGVVRAAPGQHR